MYAPTREELRLLLDIIASLYHGDSSRRIRQQIAQALLQLLRADYLASYVRDNASGRFEDCVAVNIGADRLALYEEYFQHHDPITPLLQQRRQATLVSAVIAQSELEKTEFFNDFLIRGGLHHGIDLHLHDGDRHLGDLRIWRARQQPPFGQREVTLLEMLKPHLANALAQLATLQRERSNSDNWQALWASHPDPCFILDRNGTELQRNRSASVLLEQIGEAQRALLAGFLQQTGKNAASGQLWGGYLATAVRIQCAPQAQAGTLIQLMPQQRPLPAMRDSMQCFGLTQREAQVCSLVLRGQSDKEISRQLSISFPTVRTHLGHIFSKAGVTSRTELIHQVSLRQR
ncbi:MAG: LuxR C-terminal-related transcriptional regulator [Oxalobacteraceae bacterium]|nr:LuxR C-terminal-related transcriptional regulator [Oxalobacteraceae bacterium]